MTRVLHLIASNQRRGAETFGVELAAELARRGHTVDVLAVMASPAGPYHDVRVAGRTRLDPRGLARIAAAARRADVIVSFGSITLQIAALTSALTRRPFVYRNIGDPAVWGAVRGADARIGRPLRSAARIVAVFPGARDEMTHRYRIDPDRVDVIPRGVPAERFPVADDQRRQDARARLGIDSSRPWALYAGALSAEKDPLLAISAIAAHPDAGLLICGDGPLANAIAGDSLLAPERRRFLGPVNDVRDVMAAADLLLLTSHTEGVPGVGIEAGLTGLPVVAPRVGGIPFLVSDRSTGVLVDQRSPEAFATAIEEAIVNGPQLGRNAAARCREVFSMSAVADAWERTIAQSVAGAADAHA